MADTPEPVPADDGEDLLEVGRDDPKWWLHVTVVLRGIPRRARLLLYVAAAGAAAVIVATVTPSSGPHPTPRTITSPGPTLANRVDIAAPGPGAKQSTLDAVRALARHRGPASQLVRETSAPGSCEPVQPGRSPARAIDRAVRSVLPAFTVKTSSRTLDQFTGMCALELRSPQTRGAVLVVSVSAPTRTAGAQFEHISTGFESDGIAGNTKYVLTVTRRGWRILVGATGSTAALPPVEDLLALTERPGLTW